MKLSECEQMLAVLTVAPSLEDPLIDWLLASEFQSGFTSMQVSGHSSHHGQLSTVEQVTGRQRRVQFQIQLASQHVDAFIDALHAEFHDVNLHYWVQPICASGR